MGPESGKSPGKSPGEFPGKFGRRSRISLFSSILQYDACIAEIIHYILGKYDEGGSFEKAKRYALETDAKHVATWRFTPIFDFDVEVGLRKSVVLVEIRQERQRQDTNSMVAARGMAPTDHRKQEEDRVGGEEEKPRSQYPVVQNLSAVERKAGYSHKPLGKNDKAICYAHSSHDGCSKGDTCMFPHNEDASNGSTGMRAIIFLDEVGCCPRNGLKHGRWRAICRHSGGRTPLT